jgi:hypothetical protein
MSNLKARIIRGFATTAAVGALVVAGISPAMAISTPDNCSRSYQNFGFTNPGDCVNYFFNPHH